MSTLLTGVLALTAGPLVGLGLGWYLRPLNAWCPNCGWTLRCVRCGARPATRTRSAVNQTAPTPGPDGQPHPTPVRQEPRR